MTGVDTDKIFAVIRLLTRSSLLGLCALVCAMAASAQFPAATTGPFSRQVPSGTGACSIAKSCAEVAPAIIQSALAPSPLEENLRYLDDSGGTRITGSAEAARVITWAVAALRSAGLTDVRTDKFTVPGGNLESENVLAEIRGRELPDEFVIVAAHLDSKRGEKDMAADEAAAVVIEAARAVHTSGSLPRRSIRFVLFTGANEEMAGARAYVRKYREELARTIAAISVNGGASPINGFSLGGRKEISDAVRKSLEPVRSLGVTYFTNGVDIQKDGFDFLLEGVPTLAASYTEATSADSGQSESGKVNEATIQLLKKQSAIVGVSAYALADSEERIGVRQSREMIEELLRDTNLDQKMKADGLWREWEQHERGRQP